MKVNKRLLPWMLACVAVAHAQEYPIGIRSQAMGGSGVAMADDAETQWLNPALLADLERTGLTVFYGHPFGIKEIALTNVSAAANLGRLSLGSAALRLGAENFSDQWFQFALAAKTAITKKKSQTVAGSVSFGMQAALRRIEIEREATNNAFILNAGLQARFNSQWAWGAALGNLTGAKMSGNDEYLPRSMAFGVVYEPYAELAVQLDLYKQSDFPQEIRGGIEIAPVSPLLLRFGISTNPDRLTFGFAIQTRFAALQFAAFSHAELGWTQLYAVTLRK